jgi:hypothetical protein
MFCVHCGVENPEFGRFCRKCGKALIADEGLSQAEVSGAYVLGSENSPVNLAVISTSSQATTEAQNKQATAQSYPCGVGGWLLFVCIALTIGGPLLFVIAKVYEFRNLSQIAAVVPNAPTLYLVDTLLTLVLVAYGVYTGIALWKVRSQAPITMRNFLLVSLAFSIGQHFYYWAGEPFFVSLLATALWLAYLRRSRRVRATWPNVDTLFWFERPKPWDRHEPLDHNSNP